MGVDDELSGGQPDRRNPERLKAIIQEVVRETTPAAVKHTFANMGVDISTPGALLEVQKDFAYVRSGRLRREKFWEGAGAQFVKMVMYGAGLLGVVGLVAWLGQFFKPH